MEHYRIILSDIARLRKQGLFTCYRKEKNPTKMSVFKYLVHYVFY